MTEQKPTNATVEATKEKSQGIAVPKDVGSECSLCNVRLANLTALVNHKRALDHRIMKSVLYKRGYWPGDSKLAFVAQAKSNSLEFADNEHKGRIRCRFCDFVSEGALKAVTHQMSHQKTNELSVVYYCQKCDMFLGIDSLMSTLRHHAQHNGILKKSMDDGNLLAYYTDNGDTRFVRKCLREIIGGDDSHSKREVSAFTWCPPNSRVKSLMLELKSVRKDVRYSKKNMALAGLVDKVKRLNELKKSIKTEMLVAKARFIVDNDLHGPMLLIAAIRGYHIPPSNEVPMSEVCQQSSERLLEEGTRMLQTVKCPELVPDIVEQLQQPITPESENYKDRRWTPVPLNRLTAEQTEYPLDDEEVDEDLTPNDEQLSTSLFFVDNLYATDGANDATSPPSLSNEDQPMTPTDDNSTSMPTLSAQDHVTPPPETEETTEGSKQNVVRQLKMQPEDDDDEVIIIGHKMKRTASQQHSVKVEPETELEDGELL